MFASFSGIPRRIWLLSLVNLVNRCGAMVICFLTLYLTEKLHFTLTDAGIAMSFYGIGAICGQYLGGYATDHLGYQRIQLLSLIGSGVLLLVLMQIKDYYALCAVLFLYNVIGEAFRPANGIAVRMNSNEENRTRSFSLMRVAFNLAIMFALTIGGFLISFGWEFIFWADALTCFASAALLYFAVPTLHAPDRSVAAKAAFKTERKTTKSAYTDRRMLLFTAMTFLNALVFMQIIWTLPAFFKYEYHWNELTIGLVSALNGFVVMIVELPLVFRIEKTRPTLWLVRIGLWVYAISYAVFLLPHQFLWFSAIFYMVVISFGEILVMPFSTTWVMRRSSDAKQGQYMSLYGIAYSTANVFAPLLGTQIIVAFGYNALWVILVVLCMLSWVGFGYLARAEM